MSDARETAQAFSEGLNCIAEIAGTLKANASPSPGPDWLVTMEAMERALEAIRSRRFTTTMVVTDALIDQTREVRRALSRWQGAGPPPQELLPLAENILRSLRL